MGRCRKAAQGWLLASVVFVTAASVSPGARGRGNGQDPGAAAQSSGAAPAPDRRQQPKSDGETKKLKKVWTNEDLGDAKGPVSPAEEGKNPSAPKSAATKQANPQYVAGVRRQLQKLQAQLVDVNKQISDLEAFNKGEVAGGSGGMKLHKGYSMEPVDEQIKKLQEKRKQTEAKIDALLDDARKNGVEPGQLR